MYCLVIIFIYNFQKWDKRKNKMESKNTNLPFTFYFKHKKRFCKKNKKIYQMHFVIIIIILNKIKNDCITNAV